MKLGDTVVVTLEGSEIFEEGTEWIGTVVGVDPILVGWYPIGPNSSIVFGPQSYERIEPAESGVQPR